MIRIHDKATKFMNDVHKKKFSLGNKIDRAENSKETVKKDTQTHNIELTSNNCCYCHKVFVSPKFLLKHILRRHPEDLIALHRKSLRLESNNKSSDFKGVLDYLQEEFTELRKEIQSVKQAYVSTVSEDKCNVPKQQEFSTTNEDCNELQQPMNSAMEDADGSDTTSITIKDKRMNEIKLVQEKVLDMESNIQCLHNKVVELDAVVKGEFLYKQEIHNLIASSESKILRSQEAQLRELRSNLLKNLHVMLSDQLQEYNTEWKIQFSALKQDVERLDHLIDIIRKQINSPDHLTALEKKLERQLVNFIGISSKVKGRTGKERHSNLKKNSSMTKRIKEHQGERIFKMNNSGNSSKIAENSNKQKESAYYLSPNKLAFILAEKMAYFGLPPRVSSLSNAEYEEKIKLINSEKEICNNKWPDFSNVYNQLNTYADQRVINKLRGKTSRKLRFSEPLTSEENLNYSSHRNFQNKTYPTLNGKIHELSVCHVDGSGDSFWNFKELQHRSKQQLESTSIKESETFSSVDESQNFQVEKTKSRKDGCFSRSSVSFQSDKKIGYASSKEQLDSSSSLADSLKPMDNSQGFQTRDIVPSKNNFSLSSLPFDTDNKTHCASMKVLEKVDYTSDDPVPQADKTYTKYPEKLKEEKDNEIDDSCSLKSLSSWESEENPS